MVLYGVLERPLGKMLCLVIELILLNCISKLILVFIHHSPIVGSIWNCIVLHYNQRAIRFRVLWFQIIPGDAIERPSSIILWMVCGQLHLGIACSYGIKFFKIIFILNHDRLFLIILAILIRNSGINHRGPVRSNRTTYLPIPQPGRRLNETRARSIIMHQITTLTLLIINIHPRPYIVFIKLNICHCFWLTAFGTLFFGLTISFIVTSFLVDGVQSLTSPAFSHCTLLPPGLLFFVRIWINTDDVIRAFKFVWMRMIAFEILREFQFAHWFRVCLPIFVTIVGIIV